MNIGIGSSEGQGPAVLTPPQQLPLPLVVPQVPTDSYLPAILSDESYFPLVLQRSEENMPQESDFDGDGAATVIPLITELGIKD
jgi:hypothetical protein